MVVPAIADGSGFTVRTLTAEQPELTVYEILAVPLLLPVTNPVVEPTEAISELLLDHVPPGAGSLKNTDEPTQSAGGPTIAEGNGNTLMD